MTIDLRDWRCSYREFIEWVRITGADVRASSHSYTAYHFSNNSDVVAFKLKFTPEEGRRPLDYIWKNPEKYR